MLYLAEVSSVSVLTLFLIQVRKEKGGMKKHPLLDSRGNLLAAVVYAVKALDNLYRNWRNYKRNMLTSIRCCIDSQEEFLLRCKS